MKFKAVGGRNIIIAERVDEQRKGLLSIVMSSLSGEVDILE